MNQEVPELETLEAIKMKAELENMNLQMKENGSRYESLAEDLVTDFDPFEKTKIREKIALLLGRIWGFRSYSCDESDEIIINTKKILKLMGVKYDCKPE